ncbi:MAG TPA: nucleoside-diphosphate sugar epimerase/dehydratase, partial [Candidatus Ozemobacteraceae bacterium]|nr:nucleoside-diphosphate sugar epimerase/dehydratase [Candidatus Ozemobacteraceae bacterium]
YTSISDLIAVFTSVTGVTVLKMIFLVFAQQPVFSRAVLTLDWLLGIVLIGATRIIPRLMLNLAEIEPLRTYVYGKSRNAPRRVLIYGAGQCGESVVREINRNENLPYRIMGFLDDDPHKTGKIIHGYEVLGGRTKLNQSATERHVDEIIIAMPSAPGGEIREIMRLCRGTRLRFKTLPGIQDMLEGKLLSKQLRDISVEDLLRRPPAETNLAEIAAYITGKNVLVTGAGGSIGSEICRQILPFQPLPLILLGHGENSIYNIHEELRGREDLGQVKLKPVIADVADETKILAVFRENRPDIVFHAAAHKHVPLMESNPEEAVKNNILGTFNMVKMAHDAKVERFVMISTDKAVNPTSVMGASKRFAEMVMKAFAKRSSTRFCAVRFGNVLGSRGSVVPLFKKQIERGGPVTVTHPNMIRYFMTIPEA